MDRLALGPGLCSPLLLDFLFTADLTQEVEADGVADGVEDCLLFWITGMSVSWAFSFRSTACSLLASLDADG